MWEQRDVQLTPDKWTILHIPSFHSNSLLIRPAVTSREDRSLRKHSRAEALRTYPDIHCFTPRSDHFRLEDKAYQRLTITFASVFPLSGFVCVSGIWLKVFLSYHDRLRVWSYW